MKFTSLISQIGKPQNVAESLVNRTSKWVAQHFGISLRQAQRYKSGHATLSRPQDRARREQVTKSASAETRRTLAAIALRAATAVNVGRIAVVDKSPRKKGPKAGENYRNVGVVQLDPASRERMDAAADAIAAGDTQRAEELMGEAILRTAGKDYGSALSVADWPTHFHLI